MAFLIFTVGGNSDAEYFTIHSKTGVITTSEVLDHEARNPRYIFSVQARDAGNPSKATTTDIQVHNIIV